MSKTFISLLIFFSFIVNLNAQKSVNVGIYQNAPKIFMDDAGKPSGFFVELLNEIAQKESWKLHYIPCAWSQCLDMTEAGNIDIMPDVAYTPEREKHFIFGKEDVLASWSVVYRHREIPIDSILDLDKKKVAVLKNSVQSHAVRELISDFNIEPLYKDVGDYATAFVMLQHKEVDAVVTNSFYDPFKALPNGNFVKTNIVIVPATMKFAFSKKQSDLQERVDSHLRELKKEKSSVFYQAKRRWLEPLPSVKIPAWIYWTILGGILVIALLFVLVVVFRKMVREKSEELLKQEETMIAQSRQAAMGEMIAMIAHQWRQPLSVISMSINNLELPMELDEEITKRDLEKHIHTVSAQIDHLSKTIDDFRDFFKPNKVKEKILLSSLFDNVQTVVGSSLANNDISMVVKNENDYAVSVFPNEMMQVLLTLINNAKDALKEEQPREAKITISTFEREKSIRIEICDNGGGIPDKVFNKIGVRYFTTKEKKGTGLGLYMSKIIVENHLGGTLEWKNRDNGACFTITLPK